MATAPASADPYTFLDLTSCCAVEGSGTTLGTATIAAAVNDYGDVAGTSVIGGANQAFIVREGKLTLLEALPSEFEPYGAGNSPFSGADDLNDADTVVGWSSDGAGTRSANFSGGEHPVAWRPFAEGASDAAFDFGQLEASAGFDCSVNAPPDGWDCYGFATNVTESDDVTGQADFTHEPTLDNWWLFPWLVPAGNRQLVQEGGATPPPSPDMLFYLDTGTTAATSYYVSGIRESATASQDQVVVWPDPADSPQALGNSAVCNTNAGSTPKCTTVPLDAGYHHGARHAINSSGMVIGRNDATGLAGVFYQGAVTTLAALPGDAGTEATAINDNGDVVGASIPGGESTACPSAVLWPAGQYDQPIDLNAAESSKDEQLFLAQDISDANDIVGQGGTCNNNGSYVGNAHPWELIAPTPPKAKLTVTLAGAGSGTVTGIGSGAASGIDCPTTCEQNFAAGSQVTLAATPSGDSTFSGFTGGGCSGTASSCVVTMTQAQEVTATFDLGAASPAPKCTLAPGPRTVLLKRKKKNKRPPGTLALSAKCTQKLSARLTGTVIVPTGTKAGHGKHGVRHVRHRARHGKHKARTYALHALRASLAAGKVKVVTVKLPAPALTAIRHHRHESAMFVLTGTNSNGTARATAAIKAIKGLK
jgi:hypothetical protein